MEVQAVVQYLFLALRQHGEVELPLERLELRDTIQELLNPVQINSRGDPPERVIALRAAQGGDKIKIRIVETEQTSQPLITQQSDRKKMKARYEQLKDELKEKGLIK